MFRPSTRTRCRWLYDPQNAELNTEKAIISEELCADRLCLNVIFFIQRNIVLTSTSAINIRCQSFLHASLIHFLAILIDDNLSFADHVKSVYTKINRSVGMIRKLTNFISKNSLKGLFLILFTPLCFIPPKFRVHPILHSLIDL